MRGEPNSFVAIRHRRAARWPLVVLPWGIAILALILLPKLFAAKSAIGTLNQIGILAIFALSYNVLLGLTGMLSFGHGMFFGFAGFVVIHAINVLSAAKASVPLVVIPLLGALASLVLAAIFGKPVTKRGGTAFAMITLGLGEMIWAATAIFKGFFGGEEGITTDRSGLMRFFGYDFGSPVQVYYLIVFWGVVSAAFLAFLPRTPLGQMAAAVRENENRVEFLGYHAATIRYLAFLISAFFAGIAGALAAINFEIMTASNVSGQQSALVLLMTYIGGVGHFLGPVIGAVVIGLMQIWLSDITPGWQLYFGLLFILVVMVAPGGIAGALAGQAVLLNRGAIFRALPAYALALFPLALAVLGAIILIELGYQAGLKATEGNVVQVFRIAFDTRSVLSWLSGGGLFLAGIIGLRLVMPRVESAYEAAAKHADGRLT